jgi:hypothetical protein
VFLSIVIGRLAARPAARDPAAAAIGVAARPSLLPS